MVFIRPTILADAANANKHTRERYELTQQSQRNYYDKPAEKAEPVLLPEFETMVPRPEN